MMIFSCNSAVSFDGGFYKGAETSIAQGVANYFNIPVVGAGAGVSYDNSGPYINSARANVSWLENYTSGFSPFTGFSEKNGGGGWQTVQPQSAEDKAWGQYLLQGGIMLPVGGVLLDKAAQLVGRI